MAGDEPSREDLSGELRVGHYVSNLIVRCFDLEFTGGILIWNEDAGCEGRILFQKGRPFHAGGECFQEHKLGQILLRLGSATQEDLDLALRTQANEPEKLKTKLGEILRKEALIEDAAIEAALAIQTKKRVSSAFAIQSGMWRGLWSKSENIVTKGVPIDGWSVLRPGLVEFATEDELRRFSDDLLGSAIHMTCAVEEALHLGIEEEDEEILRLLDKPRKPEQVERQIGDRRKVRGLLKALDLGKCLERVPAHKGVPLTSASRPSGATSTASGDSTIPPRVASVPADFRPSERPRTDPAMDASTLRLIKEMQTFGASLREKSLFQVFSVDEDATDDDVRARYTDLVRRFHPDRLSQQGLRQEILDQAKDLSSRLNDAYQTLANAESRKKYLALVKDERIKGSAVRKVQIEEADKKFKMAQILLKKRDFARCRDLLKTSLEIDPNNGEYKAYMAWALWMDPTLLKDVITPKVVGLLKDAVRLAPENAQVHYFIGSVMKVTGDNAAAVKHFKKAVSVDPSHVDASRELRLVEMRKKK